MKKVIAAFLCIIMLFSVLNTVAFGTEDKNDTPIIIIPGFMQTHLFTTTQDSDKTTELWFPNIKNSLEELKNSFVDISLSLLELFYGNPAAFGKALGEYFVNITSSLKCLPDGSSLLPVRHYDNDPALRNVAAFSKKDNCNKLLAYYFYIDYICSKGYADKENVFVFEYDGRSDAITIADELRQFIKEVKSYTGKEKVTLMGISYGGQIAETYLHFYKEELDVKKAVLCVPSLKGTNFGNQLLLGKTELAFDDIIDFAESVLGVDTELYNLFKGVDTSALNIAVNSASELVASIVKYWGSVYSLTSPEYYEELKNEFLDPIESADIIEKNDIIHYEIMPSVETTLQQCSEMGIEIAIMACSGIELALGGEENSDLLLSVEDVTGSTCTLLGERFGDGYIGKKTNCDNTEHYHISPSMEIDATTAYLPENTWFINGSYHAMFQFEDYGMELAAKLVCTDELNNIHSDPRFPQYVCSDNPHRGVYAEFDSSTSGYISSMDTCFVIENKYTNSPVKILSVTAKGIDITFPENICKTLKPGEKAEIAFTGDVPAVSAARAEITVTYLKLNDGIIYSRDFDITINNGQSEEPAMEIIENEYFDINNTSAFSPLKKFILYFIYPIKIIIYVIRLLNPFA